MKRYQLRGPVPDDFAGLGRLYAKHLDEQQRWDPLLAADRDPRFDAASFLASRWASGADQVRVVEAGGRVVGFVRFSQLADGVPRPARPPRQAPRPWLSPARALLVGRSLLGRLHWRLRRAGPRLRRRPAGVISDVYVAPAWRGQGVAAALVHSALTWYRHQGIEAITVQFLPGNAAAQRLWEHLGFEPCVHTYWIRPPL